MPIARLLTHYYTFQQGRLDLLRYAVTFRLYSAL